LDAISLSHKADGEEWRLEYQSLREEYDTLKQENEKIIRQQLDVALIGRRTAIQKTEDMETSFQIATQENTVLKVAHEEAEKEIMHLNHDKSMFGQQIASLEEQLKVRETAIETVHRELTEVKAKLISVVKENQQLQQSIAVEMRSPKQHSLPQQSLCNELDNVKLQLTKAKTENEKIRQMHSESLTKLNMLQTELHSTKAQLALQKQLQERDAKLLHLKDQKEEESKTTINKLNQKIDFLEQYFVKAKQTHGTLTSTDYLKHSEAATNQDIQKLIDETHSSVDTDGDPLKEVDCTSDKLNYLLTNDPMHSLSASLDQSQTNEPIAKSNTTTLSHPIPQVTAAWDLSGTGNVVEQVPVVSSSMPSLQSSSASYHTTVLYIRKSVCTASGEDIVMCKQIVDVSDLSCGQKVVTQRTNDKYQYGTVRAFPKYINGKTNFVGVELDLPSMFNKLSYLPILTACTCTLNFSFFKYFVVDGRSDGSVDDIYHFHWYVIIKILGS